MLFDEFETYSDEGWFVCQNMGCLKKKLTIRMLVDGMESLIILEVMTNDFYTRKQDAVLTMCFYMACVLEVEEALCAILVG